MADALASQPAGVLGLCPPQHAYGRPLVQDGALGLALSQADSSKGQGARWWLPVAAHGQEGVGCLSSAGTAVFGLARIHDLRVTRWGYVVDMLPNLTTNCVSQTRIATTGAGIGSTRRRGMRVSVVAEPRCETCRYWHKPFKLWEGPSFHRATCRRYPYFMIPDNWQSSRESYTDANYWCGEWREREAETCRHVWGVELLAPMAGTLVCTDCGELGLDLDRVTLRIPLVTTNPQDPTQR